MVASALQEKATRLSRKRPRFRGYVCDDEVEEQDIDLANTIHQKGRTFTLDERARARKESATAPQSGNTAALPSNNTTHHSSIAIPATEIATNPPLNDGSTLPIKKSSTFAPTDQVPSISREKEVQLPRRKPRFHGYVCDDEVDQQNEDLADVIRQKGRTFKLGERAMAGEESTPGVVKADTEPHILSMVRRNTFLTRSFRY